MTTGDEEAESLVDNLFRDVDDQFKDLEREYNQAREGLANADSERGDPLEASNDRYALLSEAATLRADLARQADELDERDRMLAELGDKIAGYEADVARRDETLTELHDAHQEVLEARREQNRLQALLDARAAEREELAGVAHGLQNERDHVQELLTTALARFDEVEALNIQMDDKVRHLEAARDTAAQEHDARAHELIESRAEMSKLTDKLDEYSRTAQAASVQAEKSEALAERRVNEANYLKRRIDAMAEKLADADGLRDEVSELRRTIAMDERRITELERDVSTYQAEAAASNAAVDAIAERTSDYDELVARAAQLEQERDAAWEAASGHPQTAPAPSAAASTAAASTATGSPAAAGGEVSALADRARELGARRSNEAEAAAQRAEESAARAVDGRSLTDDVEGVADKDDDLERLDNADVALIDADLAGIADADSGIAPVDAEGAAIERAATEDAASELAATEPGAAGRAEPADTATAGVLEFDGTEDAADAAAAELPDIESIPRVSLDHLDPAPPEIPRVEISAPSAPGVALTPTGEIPAIGFAEPPAPPAPPSEVSPPQVTLPDLATSEGAMSQGALPEVVLPEDALAQSALPEVVLPEVSPPEVALPEVALPGVTLPEVALPEVALPDVPLPEVAPPEVAPPEVAVPEAEIALPEVASPEVTVPEVPAPEIASPHSELESEAVVPSLSPPAVAVRKRAILPADLIPNSPEAVAHLLSQPGVSAIVDARSTCGRTGIRPSELFEKVASLRDHFDVPVEVVVTPVSTPVGGAPDLPAIGVHYVTGADTVADRIRALCMGFPADQPLVVIAGDDHVRRAAIGEEANVVEPAAVLDVAAG